MGWDVKEEAIVGLKNNFEYTTFQEENSFDEDKAEWTTCQENKISIPKYGTGEKLSYAFRRKSDDTHFTSRMQIVPKFKINYDLGIPVYEEGEYRGIYAKVAVFGKTEPTAVVDFTEFIRRGGDLSKIKFKIEGMDEHKGFAPIPDDVYKNKTPATDTYILEQPINEGENIYLLLDGITRGIGRYQSHKEKEALSHIDIFDDGRFINFEASFDYAEYEYSIDDAPYVKAARSLISTGFNGSNSVNIKIRGRLWFRTTETLWEKTISRDTLDSGDHLNIKDRHIRLDLESLEVYLDKYGSDHYK